MIRQINRWLSLDTETQKIKCSKDDAEIDREVSPEELAAFFDAHCHHGERG